MIAERTTTSQRWRDLHRLLSDLAVAHEALLDTLTAKLQAMRAAAPDALQHLVHREGELTHAIAQRTTLRRQLMDHIARELGQSLETFRHLPLRDVVKLADPAWVEPLRTVGERLRVALQRIGQANQRCHRLAEGMLIHHRAILQAATVAPGASAVYDLTGRRPAPERARVIDALC